MSNIVFLKTAWMDYYDRRKADKIEGKHSYVQEHDEGHEDRNFLLRGKYARGYAPFKDRLHLSKHFDVDDDAPYVDATIIWIAKAPGKRGVV